PRVSERDPCYMPVLLGMGPPRCAAGRPPMGAQSARKALAERPGLIWPYRALAAYYAHQGDLPAAQQALAKFVAEHPGVTLATVRDGLRFMNSELLEKYAGGLERAGLR